jgi:hypothetical protein
MLELQRFLIKEHVAFLRRVDTYDIVDPESGQKVGIAREMPGTTVKLLRWFVSKKLMPTQVEVCETEDESLVFTIRRPLRLWRQRIDVYDAEERLVGYLRSRVFSSGGGFRVYDYRGNLFAHLQGDWLSWNFAFLTPDGKQLGLVSKTWAGLGKELFTTAEDYFISMHEELEDQPIAKMLLLGAALAIDMVYYDQKQ